MTTLTGDAIGNLEALAAKALGYDVCMTIEANFGFVGRLFKAQIPGDAFGTIVEQHVVGARMLVGTRPGQILVL